MLWPSSFICETFKLSRLGGGVIDPDSISKLMCFNQNSIEIGWIRKLAILSLLPLANIHSYSKTFLLLRWSQTSGVCFMMRDIGMSRGVLNLLGLYRMERLYHLTTQLNTGKRLYHLTTQLNTGKMFYPFLQCNRGSHWLKSWQYGPVLGHAYIIWPIQVMWLVLESRIRNFRIV